MLWIFILALTMPFSLANASSIYCGDCTGSCCGKTVAQLQWAHAVNSKAELEAALTNDNIQMIEADVVMGKVIPVTPPEENPQPNPQQPNTAETDKDTVDATAAADEEPIMAHPPATTSDLSLVAFVDKVADHNKVADSKKKGIKLDFKTIEAVKKSLPLMKGKEVNGDVWINADILVGPGKSDAKPVDAVEFFKAVKSAEKMEKTTLSVGWTTGMTKKDKETITYTHEHVDEMIKSIQDNKVETTHPITFPVRAVIAVESKKNLKHLATKMEELKYKVTFTLWTSEKNDKLDVEKLQDFISEFGVDKVYVDLPEDLKNKLKLGSSKSGASNLIQYGLLNIVAIFFALFFRNGFF